MSSARRARPFAEDVYSDDQEQTVAPEPHAGDDRTFLILQFQEHGSLAREHEQLSSLWMAIVLGLGCLLGVAGVDAGRQFACGIALVVVGVVGGLAIAKHRQRYDLHSNLMRANRNALAETVRRDLAELSLQTRIRHRRKNRLLSMISLSGIAVIGCFGTIGLGCDMAWRSLEAENAPRPAAARTTPMIPSNADLAPLRPGQELP